MKLTGIDYKFSSRSMFIENTIFDQESGNSITNSYIKYQEISQGREMAGTLPFSYKLNPQLLKIFELNSALFHSTSFYFKNRGTMQIYRRRNFVLDMWWSVTPITI